MAEINDFRSMLCRVTAACGALALAAAALAAPPAKALKSVPGSRTIQFTVEDGLGETLSGGAMKMSVRDGGGQSLAVQALPGGWHVVQLQGSKLSFEIQEAGDPEPMTTEYLLPSAPTDLSLMIRMTRDGLAVRQLGPSVPLPPAVAEQGVCGAGAGDCFSANGTPGCDDEACCNTVCAIDPFCCNVSWDQICANEAAANCNQQPGACCFPDSSCLELTAGACTGAGGNPQDAGTTCEMVQCPTGPCGPGAGDCFSANGTPGCDDEACCNTVCAIDPFCCDVTWDGICATEAAQNCDMTGGTPANDLCANATPIMIGQLVSGTTTGATIDNQFPTCGTSITAPGVWYSVIGNGNTLTATTCGPFFGYDTKLSVFCTCAADAANNCVGGNDDSCVGGGSGLLSTVTWCSQSGCEYLILVHGFSTATGQFDLIVNSNSTPCTPTVLCCDLVATGCCCFPNGASAENQTEADCLAQGGEWQGPDAPCFGAGLSQMTVVTAGLAIPDNSMAGVSSSVMLTDIGPIGDVNVSLDIDHTWIGDLVVTLTQPGGPTITLIDRPGTPPGSFGCSNNNYQDIVLDDEGTGGAIEAQCVLNLTSPPSYTPNNPLSGFDGGPSAGLWTLNVSDRAGGDLGTLNSWCITRSLPGASVCVNTGCCCFPDGSSDELTEADCVGDGGEYQGDGTVCLVLLTGGTLWYDIPAGLAIPDDNPAGVSHTFNVPDSAIIGDVDVDLTISHTWVGDLIVRLEHLGTTVTLIDRPGVPLSTFGCPSNDYDIILDDEGGGGPIETLCGPTDGSSTPTSPPSYTPNGSLGDFDGLDSAGDWTITVSDHASPDAGTLVSWSLHIAEVDAVLCGPDCNMNNVPDDVDIMNGTSQDCQPDGIPDECQVPPDCNLNGIPDDCEPDCQPNMIPDDCDIANGTSQDCQPDGIPDECQLWPDCNWNQIPDECEVDCNKNGIPDDCDIASGFSQDCQPNGIPDECEEDCNENGIPDDCETAPEPLAPDWNGQQDDCEDAEHLCVKNEVHGDTYGTWRDGPTECDGTLTLGGDVWYRYRPAWTGVALVSSFGSPDPVVLSVHTSCPGEDWNQVACGGPPQTWVKWMVEAKQVYYIRVSGVNLAQIDFQLELIGPDCALNELDCNSNGIPDECECLADVDGDGEVDVWDLIDVQNHYGPCPLPPWECPWDVDGDGEVDDEDALIVLRAFGPCPFPDAMMADGFAPPAGAGKQLLPVGMSP